MLLVGFESVRFTYNLSKDVNKKINPYTGKLVIFSFFTVMVLSGLEKNPESSMSETETRPRPSKSPSKSHDQSQVLQH